MKRTILSVIFTAFLCSCASFAMDLTADFTWNKMTGTEHYKLYSTDSYSGGKITGSLIRLDLLNDKGEIKRSDIINTRRNYMWQLFSAEKIGARYEYHNEPCLFVTSDWIKDPQTAYLRDEVCNGIPCKVYYWVSKNNRFFKIEYYYWISKDNIIIKQEDTKLRKALQTITNLKTHSNGTLKPSLFLVPDDYEVVKVQ